MSYTKKQIVLGAFNEVGFANYLFDLAPEQMNNGLTQLDLMMGSWYANGVNLGYPLYNDPTQNDIDQPSNLPIVAVEAVILGLANRIAPSLGKTMSPESKQNFQNAYQSMLNYLAVIPSRVFPDTLPCGAGNRRLSPGFNFIIGAQSNG